MKKQKGLTLVEVVIGTSIVAVMTLVLAGVFQLYFRVILSSADTIKAGFLAEETVEAVKFMRKASWHTYVAPLSLNTPYYLSQANGLWATSPAVSYIDGSFDRSFTLSAVYRDSNSNITDTGGTLDPNTLKLVSTVNWNANAATTTRSITTYITNLYDN